jgi:hypothetical protein
MNKRHIGKIKVSRHEAVMTSRDGAVTAGFAKTLEKSKATR